MPNTNDHEKKMSEANKQYDVLVNGRQTFDRSQIIERYRTLSSMYEKAMECSTAASFDELYELAEVAKEVIKKLEKLHKVIYPEELSGQYKPFVPIYKHVRDIAVQLYDPNRCEEIPDFAGDGRSIIGLQDIQVWCRKASGIKVRENKTSRHTRQKNRPTKTDMANRNKTVAYVAGEFKAKYDRLPNVDEIVAATKLSRNQVYATDVYKDGKIARSSAKVPDEMLGRSVQRSEYCPTKSKEQNSRDERSKSDQAELETLIEEQAKDAKSRYV